MVTEKIVNGIKCHFNHDHYCTLRRVREAKGIPLLNQITLNKEWKHYYHEGNKIIEHPLLYKVIRDKETKTLYIVTKVLRQFFAGWHTVLQYDNKNGSSGIVHLDNGTSIAMPSETDFDKRFEVTDITIEQFFEGVTDSLNAFGEKANEWFYHHKATNDKVLKHFAQFA